ncbi:VanW family protein [Streptomyces nojiriensis]|uniref:VanW family protein n=1 Tax=Streptomyces nojiriensis TaxID=66374 RepID=UPI00364C8EE7
MRRASPTGTGTPAERGRRWTASGIAGAAAGAAAPVALRIGERTEQADPAALGLSLDSAATADRAARTGSGPLTVIGRLFASGDPDLAPVVRLDEKAARGALDGIGEKTGVRAREGSVAFAKGRAEAVAPVTGIAVDVDGALDGLRAGYPRTPDPGAGAGTEPLTLPVRLTEPKVGRAETDRALSAAVLPLLTGTGAAARTGEVATESVAPRLTEDTVERLGIKEKVSSYIERYPEGREATVAWGSPDLRFANDSGKALHIQAEATDTAATIIFLGTRKYEEIRAHQGPWTNVKQPATRTDSGPKCEPQSPLEGFDVAVDRVFVQGGKEVGRETMKTRYTPRDHVTCGA